MLAASKLISPTSDSLADTYLQSLTSHHPNKPTLAAPPLNPTVPAQPLPKIDEVDSVTALGVVIRQQRKALGKTQSAFPTQRGGWVTS
jgi:hypothetical protein